MPVRLPALPPGVRVLGLTGAPGAGKSTLAAALAASWGCGVVPMDGFHYADVELRRRGLLDRKGAPETFDAEGYAALLRRVRAGEADVVAPGFDRDLEQPLAGALPVPATGLVVTEGNYLLHHGPFAPVRTLLSETWFLDVDADVRRSRLLARHVAHGRAPEAARRWVETTDEPNARLVERTRAAADVVVQVPGGA